MTQTVYKSCSQSMVDQWFLDHGHPAFRKRQINDWLFKKWAMSTDEMVNLPKGLRAQLEVDFSFFAVKPVITRVAQDQTTKFLLELKDGETVESVVIPTRDRETVCVSTQVGCPVGCVFCATGRQGFVRNLSAAEIVDQVVFACRYLTRRVTNVVVMGMGEPLLNLDGLLPALHMMTDTDALNLGARRITVSTSGIPAGIRSLAAENRQWNLALSLHAPDKETRAKLIPDRYRFPLPDVLAACQEYNQATGRRITFEYALIQGVNDALEHARGVARLARGLGAKVNLIPYNAVARRLERPMQKHIEEFKRQIAAMGVTVTVRESRGLDIEAACGQLKGTRT